VDHGCERIFDSLENCPSVDYYEGGCEVGEEGLTVSCSDHHPSVLGWEVLVWYDPATTRQTNVDEAGDGTHEGCEVPCRVASCPAIK
jgi:hypothetical protein